MKRKILQKRQLESFTHDSKIFLEIQNKIAEGKIELSESIRRQLEKPERPFEALESRMESISVDPVPAGEFNMLEAIILREGRPPLFVKDDEYEEPRIEELKKRLLLHKDKLNTGIKSVAKIEVLNHPSFTYFGTAWMIDEDIMITNRHVAQLFAYKKGKKFYVRTDAFGHAFQLQVDFREEYCQKLPPFEVEIVEVLHIERDMAGHPDMAILRIVKNRNLPAPIEISSIDPFPGQDVSVIGYPAEDGTRNDKSLMNDLFGNIYQVKRFSPGKISAVLDEDIMFSHDCTTLGGNSGSVVLANETGKAVGLHFSGSFMVNNYAVKGSTILDILAGLNSKNIYVFPPVGGEGGEGEAPPTIQDLSDRTGYDPDFLYDTIPLPCFLNDSKQTFSTLKDSQNTELKYEHYSVRMSEKRKMASVTASNIDGNKWFQIPRGRDKWYFDPRMDKKHQLGNDFYKGNNMHRGHLVRRLDPAWGDSREIALQGVEDTFYWTNCTPQHRNFNPKSWLRLEEYVLGNAINHDLKISVFTGPVFRSRDKRYRSNQIPEDYWKIIAFNHEDRGQISATAYLLSQSEFMDDVEFVYGAYKTYQVPIQKVIDLTDLDFSSLTDFDPLARNESISYFEIIDNEEIIL